MHKVRYSGHASVKQMAFLRRLADQRGVTVAEILREAINKLWSEVEPGKAVE